MTRLTRREFISALAVTGSRAASSPTGDNLPAVRGERQATEQQPAGTFHGADYVRRARLPRLLVNHVGFRPQAGKHLVADGVKGAGPAFAIVEMRQRKGFEPAFSGTLVRAGSDLGEYWVGDFSVFDKQGIYRAYVEGDYPLAAQFGRAQVWTHDFAISPSAWDNPIGKLVNYYRVQSCGPSAHGYNTPCHTGPISRDDGGPAVPIHGGWHSADDCQRDCDEILCGLFGLIHLALARPDLEDKLGLFTEIRWGNDYFQAIQSKEGYLYSGVEAIDYFGWKDKDWWDSSSYVLKTGAAAPFLQYSFAAFQALIAFAYRERHPQYATHCLQAGQGCLEFILKPQSKVKQWAPESMSYDLGTAVMAGVHMFRATGDQRYRSFARAMANRLVSAQATDGYWTEHKPSVGDSVCYAPLAAIGLCTAARYLGDDPDFPSWRGSLEKFAISFVSHFSNSNAFGILPCRVYPDQPAPGARQWGLQHYRYFIETDYEVGAPEQRFFWQTGNIAAVAGYGVAMVHLAGLLNLPWLRRLAQRQLDWIAGVNPFDSCMILGIGRNHVPTYPSKEMVPSLPDIDGAVMEGPIGDPEDNPLIIPAYYATSEYWMPHQSFTLWLMAELSAL